MLKKHLIIAFCVLSSLSIFAQFIPRDWSIQVSTTVQTNPPTITFNWVPLVEGSAISVFRKAKTDTNWNLSAPLVTLPGTATTYTDNTVVLGKGYEYFIRGYANNSNPYTYLYSGVELEQTDNRGKLILVVDNSFSSSLYTELNQLVADMTGDGWQVIRHDVSRTATVPSVKALIKSDYDADPTNVKAVYLFGHVPVPYSGTGGWDGHSDHDGAWPADGYYAEMTGVWTDNTVSTIQARRSENWNLIGDGKFDQSYFPALPILQVGRVDMEDMPAFGVSEEVLLRRYLATRLLAMMPVTPLRLGSVLRPCFHQPPLHATIILLLPEPAVTFGLTAMVEELILLPKELEILPILQLMNQKRFSTFYLAAILAIGTVRTISCELHLLPTAGDFQQHGEPLSAAIFTIRHWAKI